jgi:uncharacterized alpha-E superfamily protein
MGRYSERAEQAVRLARAALTLIGDNARAPSPVLDALATLCEERGLVPEDVPSPAQSLTVFERTLIAELADNRGSSVAFDLASLVRSAGHIRDRLSADHWRLVAATAERFSADCAAATAGNVFSADEAVAALGHLAVQLSAITGAQIDHMTRDDGWRMMTIGRQQAAWHARPNAARPVRRGAMAREDGYDLALQLFDSTITYRALYQRRLEVPPLVDLLVRNPPAALATRVAPPHGTDRTPRSAGCGATVAHLPALTDGRISSS